MVDQEWRYGASRLRNHPDLHDTDCVSIQGQNGQYKMFVRAYFSISVTIMVLYDPNQKPNKLSDLHYQPKQASD